MKKAKISMIRCGAINPYALLTSRTGKKISGNKFTPHQIRQTFEKEFNIPFHHLFDPMHGSPLFSHKTQATSTESVKKIETGETATRCSKEVAGWGQYSGNFLPKSPPDINDANQGCSLNCWFVAALASVAWVWPDLIKNPYDASFKTYLKFYKSNPESGAIPPYMPPVGSNVWDAAYSPKSKYYTSNYSLPYRSGGIGNWIYSSPNPAAATTLWPALIEKTYAYFYQLAGSSSDTPDISRFGTGNPLDSLLHLTGKRFYSKDDVNNAAAQNPGVALTQTAFFMTEFADENSVFNAIYNKCYKISSGISAMTTTPMVAWTYPTESEANRANGVDPAVNPEKSAKYTNDAIVAQHAYSILGVHFAEGKKYIVLRNPWGMSTCGGFSADPEISDPTPGDSSDDRYYSGMNASIITSYNGTPSNSIWTVNLLPIIASNFNTTLRGFSTRTVDLRNADGIFALTTDKFRWHFQGFGWAY